jgi:hypothetical protein
MARYTKSTIAIVLILLGTIPLSALASASPSDSSAIEQFRYATQQYQIYKDKYNEARRLYFDAKQWLLDAKEKYQMAKNAENLKALKEAAQAYMIEAIDYAISYLEIVKYNVQLAEKEGFAPYNASDNLQQYINELEQKKVEVQNAETKEELLRVARSIENKWLTIRVEIKYYFGYVLKNRIELFLNKAEELANKLNKEIQALRAQGIETTSLEAKLANFNNYLSQANAKLEKAKQAYAAHVGIDAYGHITNLAEASRFVEEANRNLVEAYYYLKNAINVLKALFNEYKNIKSKTLQGSGKLEAVGNGTALIEGSGTIIVSGNGMLTITDNNGSTAIQINGFGMKSQTGNVTIYEGTGRAIVTSTNFKVEVKGTDIILTAEGTGKAKLTGTGSYNAAKSGALISQGSWSAIGTTINFGGST